MLEHRHFSPFARQSSIQSIVLQVPVVFCNFRISVMLMLAMLQHNTRSRGCNQWCRFQLCKISGPHRYWRRFRFLQIGGRFPEREF